MRRASVTMVPTPPIPVHPYAQHFESLCRLLETQEKLQRKIVELLQAQQLRPDVEQRIAVAVQPITLSRNNRRFTRLWVDNGVSCLVSNLLGFAPVILQAGWNNMDLVEGAQIMVQSAPGFSAIWQCVDTVTTGATL